MKRENTSSSIIGSLKKFIQKKEALELVKGFDSLSSDEQEEFRFDNYDCFLFEAMVINAAILEGSSPETNDFLEVLIHKYLESRNVSPENLIHTATPEFYENVIDAFWLNVGVDYNAAELFEKNGLSQYSFIQQFLQEGYEKDELKKRLEELHFKDKTIELMFLNIFNHTTNPHIIYSTQKFLNDGWSSLDIGVNIKTLPLFITELDGDLTNADGQLDWGVMFFNHSDKKKYVCTLTVFFDEEGVVTKLNCATRIVGG